jgi:hypothetical protein
MPAGDISLYLDIAMTSILPFMLVPYIYEIGWGVLDVIWWIPFFGMPARI